MEYKLLHGHVFGGIFLYVHATPLWLCEKAVVLHWEQAAAEGIPHGHTGNPQRSWDPTPEIQFLIQTYTLIKHKNNSFKRGKQTSTGPSKSKERQILILAHWCISRLALG